MPATLLRMRNAILSKTLLRSVRASLLRDNSEASPVRSQADDALLRAGGGHALRREMQQGACLWPCLYQAVLGRLYVRLCSYV